MDYLRTPMTKNFMLALIAVFALTVPVIDCYGFDAGASCSDKTARRGRAQLIKSIPCDLSVQAYCNLPGTMYPWHAVRRFVNENQGMMKRMYGDVRHISVLRNEITNNDITLDDVEETAVRYSRAGWKRNKYLYQESSKQKNSDLLSEAHYRRASTARSTTGRSTTTRSRGRTTQRAGSTASTNVETSASTSTLSSSTEPIPTKKTKSAERKVLSAKLTRNTDSSKEKSNDDPYEEVIDAAIEEIFDQFDNENANKNIFANVSDNGKLVTELRNESNDNIEIVGAPDLSDKSNKSEVAATISTTLRIYGYTKDDRTTTASPLNVTTESAVTPENRTESMFLKQNSTTPKSQVDDNLIHFEVDSSDLDGSVSSEEIDDDDDSTPDESINTESIVDIDGNPKPDKTAKPSDDNTIGQLYQDVAEKEEPVLISSKGVNACPVKEEVVAPFWANNTRGEVLALLNLYPFEQYVHWEKCTQEHKQMYCRDGCRCEQQYRLHRLLAYDPHNECRGIFSDWFRFPSCCICKCYNIPFEYRVTSRSPRSLGKYTKNDGNPEMNADDNIHDELGEEPDHSSSDWFHKKSYLSDDFAEMFNEEIDF
ncbi:protein spaetzle 4 isoform X2 [Contarinia nasturtii]|uniref:protein spaetzle 4 isoform X2 n=1 Tax=Contarinia nasturtii TaxID=265458 RepID=UPI0012D4616F|nr:protein spaetzle 4 isoform X2 [Contarinia nasturtii]